MTLLLAVAAGLVGMWWQYGLKSNSPKASGVGCEAMLAIRFLGSLIFSRAA
jgi:hypothetical protein